jgi:glycosyltransferase involved in cell wall biosynthesis
MKIKVLHIIPDLGSGGAERLVVDLVKFTDKSKFDVRVCVLYGKKGTPLEEELEDLEIKTYYLGKKLGPDIRILWRLYRLLNRLTPDVIHTHRYVVRYSLIPAIICRIPRMIHTVHNQPEFEVEAIGKLVHKIAYRQGLVPVCISRTVQEEMVPIYGDIKYHLIYNGIDTCRFEGVEEDVIQSLKEEMGIANQFIVLHIGRFTEQKNHKMLIESFKIVNDNYPQSVLLLVGDGELLAEAKQMVNTLELSSKVYFLGLRTDIPEIINMADVFVLTSKWEGFGLVNIEAMAAGKPIVATEVGGVPELVDDGKTGFLVKSGHTDGLAEKILNIIQNSELQKTFSKNASIRAKMFDIRQTVIEYQNLYLKKNLGR